MNKLILLLTLFATSVFASCPNLYPKSVEIAPAGTVELCNSFYVIRFDPVKNVNIFSAEVLQPKGRQIERLNNFHHDTRLPKSPVPNDYAKTGFDKGHMVPAANSTTVEEMSETFLMTNMTPQVPTLNRIAWKQLEENVREIAKEEGESIHVITIAVYNGKESMHGIPIPSGYFKAVFAKNIDVFYADNKEHAKVITTTMEMLESTVGFKIQ